MRNKCIHLSVTTTHLRSLEELINYFPRGIKLFQAAIRPFYLRARIPRVRTFIIMYVNAYTDKCNNGYAGNGANVPKSRERGSL